MRNSCITVFLAITLLGASSCVDDAQEQSSESLLGEDDEAAGAEATLIDDTDAAGLDAEPEPGSIVSPDPSAAPRPDDCPHGFLCLWERKNYEGHMFKTRGGGCDNLGAYGFNNKASSWNNKHHRNYHFYGKRNCKGGKLTAPGGARSPNMGNWNDRTTSICRGPDCR